MQGLVTSDLACPWGGLEDVAVPVPSPQEFRDDVVRVARNREKGVTLGQIAKDFGVHEMTLSKWMRQPRTTPTNSQPPTPPTASTTNPPNTPARPTGGVLESWPQRETVRDPVPHPGLRALAESAGIEVR